MTESTQNHTAPDTWDGHSVIAVSFEDDRNAYKALTLIEELDSQRRVHVQEAVVAVRGEDGQVVAEDSADSSSDMPATAGGGLTGLLLGVIGGPIGMLLGGTYGLFVGSMVDLYDAGEAESTLGAISGSVKLGHPALLAVVDEPGPAILDAAMADLGGTVVRRPVADVEAEIAAAEDAERKAEYEARKEMDRARRERSKAAVDAKIAELKAKRPHGARAEGATAAPTGGGR
jgi:uncharacterized membrane protein